ncbi:manganese catalase family protein [Aquabacterium sp. A7-Y]|uniref:manganese catalase family protein n=1 Tax=Aquabacterium sp. A7-Y TaxID=1349605 RepID=UPI00223D1E15|nr:manganese catalase family protein [Aquabacterium sp. A7-Y]MCW7539764.1 manganese catalase family protein [Aquabacterium sp. A7-Y]
MFAHNKRLQYTVRVNETNPGLANLLLEQFGGPQGELAAACRYFTQALAEDDPGRKDMLMDIATEELSHLEVIGTIVAMLNKGAKGRISEGVDEEAEMYRSISGAGNDSHVTQVLYGGGPALINSGGQLWNAGYIDSIGDPSADLRSNIAAEARAKIIYERLINATDDPGVKEALGFLMTREIAHQQSFEKALYSMHPNFPPGKLPGDPRFTNAYFNMSQGEGDARGPWNSDDNFQYITEREEQMAVDGGTGLPEIRLKPDELAVAQRLIARTASDPASDPMTGAELGMGTMEDGTPGDPTAAQAVSAARSRRGGPGTSKTH